MQKKLAGCQNMGGRWLAPKKGAALFAIFQSDPTRHNQTPLCLIVGVLFQLFSIGFFLHRRNFTA